MADAPKPSLTDLALRSKKAFLFGNGGGGDVLQTMSIARHLEKLGIEEIYLGGVNCAWLDDDGAAQGTGRSDDPATFVLGPTIYDVGDLTESTPYGDGGLVEVSAETRLRGQMTGESAVRSMLDHRAFVIDLRKGVPAATAAVAAFVEAEGIDFVVSTDVGSDSWYGDDVAYPAHTSLVDFMSIGILTGLSCPTVFSLGGWGVDGELLPDDLTAAVGKVMGKGGFLGGLGLSQSDVLELEHACSIYHDPVEDHVPRAARGEFGWTTVKTLGPWGHPMFVSPMAAFLAFFDPEVMVAEVCTSVPAIAAATSFTDAEQAFEDHFGLPPETRLIRVAELRRRED